MLENKTSYGHGLSFQTAAHPSIEYGAELGDKVKVGYAETRSGSMAASAIRYVGAVTTSGTVGSIAPSAVTIQASSGKTLTLSTSLVPDLVYGLAVGDGVQVTYSTDASGLLIPHALRISSVPGALPGSPPRRPSGPASGPRLLSRPSWPRRRAIIKPGLDGFTGEYDRFRRSSCAGTDRAEDGLS